MPQNEQEIIIQRATSEEISDLIGNAPSWLLRSGISMIALVFFTVLGIGYFIKYPDKIQGTGTLTSLSPPIELVSRSDGYIDTILVKDNQAVKKDQVILYVNNTTNPEQIEQLTEWINEYEKIENPRKYLYTKVPENLQLGVLQNEYASLCLKYKEFQQTLKDGIVFQQIDNISGEVSKLKRLNDSQKREKKIFAQELNLSRNDYRRQESLYKDGVISQIELESFRATLLQKERQYESMENGIIQNNIRIEQLELEKLKLRGNRTNVVQNYQFAVSEINTRIKTRIESWSETYSIISPIDGRVNYNSSIKSNKPISIGQMLGNVIPENSSEKYLSCAVPTASIGKLEKGQKAIVKFDAYPYKEFGVVISTVKSVSRLPEITPDNMQYYEVKIPLKDTIVTDFGELIPYQPQMTTFVEVITEDKSIIERIFSQFLSLIKSAG